MPILAATLVPMALSQSTSGIPAAPSLMKADLPLAFYVAPTGNDGNSGTQAAPFQTIAKARDAIRTATARTTNDGAPPAGWKGATVVLLAGTHLVPATFKLDKRDSGTEPYPIVYQAVPGTSVTLEGGRTVQASDWVQVTSSDTLAWGRLPSATRVNTWKLNLAALGVTQGSLSHGAERVELIAGGELRKMARYPAHRTDEKPPDFLAANSVVNPDLGTFTDDDTHLGVYILSGQSPVVWIWPRYEYYGQWTSLGTISGGSTRTITLPSFSAVGGYLWKPMSSTDGKVRYAIYNCLEDLDRAGLYCLNTGSSILYYVTGDGQAPTDASLTRTGSLIEADGANWVSFREVTMQGVRGDVVRVIGATGFSLDGCRVKDSGGWGLVTGGRHYWDGGDVQIAGRTALSDGVTRCVVNGCTFSRLGKGALFMAGGDRALLIPADNVITGNTMSDNCRLVRTGSHVEMFGMGFEFSYNTISNLPSSAITWKAVNAQITHNTISRVVQENGDFGALYTGRSWTGSFGSVVSDNTITDVGAFAASVPPDATAVAWAIYLDAQASGVTVRNNRLMRCGNGIQIGGGKRNIIADNELTDCHHILNVKWEDSITIRSWSFDTNMRTQCDDDMTNVDGSGVSIASVAGWKNLWPDFAEYLSGGSRYNSRAYPWDNIITGNRSSTAGTYFGPPDFPNQVLFHVRENVYPYTDPSQMNYDVNGVLRRMDQLDRGNGATN